MSSRLAWRVLALSLLAVPVLAQDTPHLDVDSEWDAVLMLAPPERDGEKEDTAKKRSRRKSRAKPRRTTAAGYDALKKSWHEAPIEDGSWSEAPAPALVLRAVGDKEPVVLSPASEDGGFDETDIALATQAFGSWSGGPSVHPRLLDLIYRATRYFDVRYVHLVSGIRRDRQGSRHSHGLAADIVLPGVADDDLAAFFRAQGFVGVGIYTRAGFVHIDVREASYFWIDRSPPGKRSRIQQVRAEEAKAADAEALARGDEPHANPERLQRALNKRAVRRRAAKRKAASSAAQE